MRWDHADKGRHAGADRQGDEEAAVLVAVVAAVGAVVVAALANGCPVAGLIIDDPGGADLGAPLNKFFNFPNPRRAYGNAALPANATAGAISSTCVFVSSDSFISFPIQYFIYNII
jgi:hypothetical protein